MNFKAGFAIAGVLTGCCFDALFLEFAARVDPGCGNLITFLQFLSISLYGLIFTVKFFTVQPNIPIRDYIKLVIMFFTSSWLNNYALNFNVSVPLLMTFRSGSLIANMVLGILILNKSYDIWKYLSVIMITIGIFMCTFATGSDVKKKSQNDDDSFFYWIIGVSMLFSSLFISARVGLYQEVLYKKRGKHAAEALFYTHFLPLPLFAFMASNIYNHAVIASQVITLPVLNLTTRIQLIYLVLNFLSHYLCIKSVFILTTECTSLTVTLVITLRKFASLIYSILYFKHAFTFYHWIGTVFIIIGTIIFTEIISKVKERRKIQNFNIEEAPLKNEEEIKI